jgi:glycosyltransferase involved in cell wall biosynthesis
MHQIPGKSPAHFAAWSRRCAVNDAGGFAGCSATMSEVIHRIEAGPPEICETGTGHVHVVRGYCFHPRKRTAGIRLLVGDSVRPVDEFEDFRPDVANKFADCDESGASVSSGFFATFEALPKLAGTRQTLALEIAFNDGSSERIEIGDVSFVAPARPAAQVPVATLTICLATWNPAPAAFARQIDTLIAQDFSDWVCIVSDDDSAKPILVKIREICARDPRFHLFRNERNLGFYRNFESALKRVPAGTRFVALCDQDDIWYPDKLSASLAAFKPETQLVYCDMRIVHESGDVVAPSYWTKRKNQYRDLEVLITANTVTGAASVFRAELLAKLLPFPDDLGNAFHDHWIACAALAAGGIEYVDRPLYDYIQHGSNVIGHVDFHHPPHVARRVLHFIGGIFAPQKLKRRLVALRAWLLHVVFLQYRDLHLIAGTLRLRFAGSPGLESATASFLAPNSWGVALALRHFSPRFARDVTGNMERRLAAALAVRRLNQYYVRRRAPGIVARIRKARSANSASRELTERLVEFAGKIAPLALNIASDAPRRINLLTSEIHFDVFFGDYVEMLNVARKLAENGYRVRLVVTDWQYVSPDRWHALLQRHQGLAGFLNYVELADRSDREQPLVVNPDDRFVATNWETAHIADAAVHRLAQNGGDAVAQRGFIYLIREYEPFTYSLGSQHALAEQSYAFPHHAIFSSTLLEDFFREREIGVYGSGKAGAGGAMRFENAIPRFQVSNVARMARRKRKLLLYSRPEARASGNMFDVAILALGRAIADGAFAGEPWEFHAVGMDGGSIELAGGQTLKILGRLSPDEFRELLPDYDVGLSLMYSPHPGSVPLQMAAAGMLAVTNACFNKTAAKLAAISPNIVGAPPTIDGVAEALREAASRAGDNEARVDGSRLNWASSWDLSFDEAFMHRLGGCLGPAGG